MIKTLLQSVSSLGIIYQFIFFRRKFIMIESYVCAEVIIACLLSICLTEYLTFTAYGAKNLSLPLHLWEECSCD